MNIHITKIELHGTKLSPNLEIKSWGSYKGKVEEEERLSLHILGVGNFNSTSPTAHELVHALGSKHGQVYGKRVLVYSNHNCSGQTSKVVAKCCLDWNFFHGALYRLVRFSNTKYQDKISKLIIKSISQTVMIKFGFERRFHDLKYFEIGFFFLHIS